MLYSERNGLRPKKKYTECITLDAYIVLFNCCYNRRKSLISKFKFESFDDFTEEMHDEFDENAFWARVFLKIPQLFHGEGYSGEYYIPEPDDTYDQCGLLDFIEFMGSMLQKHTNSFYDFKSEINDAFMDASLVFKLTDGSEIVKKSEITTEIDDTVEKLDSLKDEELHDLLNSAINLYYDPRSTSRQTSMEKLWGAFERIKTEITGLDKKESVETLVKKMACNNSDMETEYNKEFTYLTNIGNKYSIRHHETNQLSFTDASQYDYFFNRCISLINVALYFID